MKIKFNSTIVLPTWNVTQVIKKIEHDGNDASDFNLFIEHIDNIYHLHNDQPVEFIFYVNINADSSYAHTHSVQLIV